MDEKLISQSQLFMTHVFGMRLVSLLNLVAIFAVFFGLYEFFVSITDKNVNYSFLIISGVSLLLIFLFRFWTAVILTLRCEFIKNFWIENYHIFGGNYIVARNYKDLAKIQHHVRIKWRKSAFPTARFDTIRGQNSASSKIRLKEIEELVNYVNHATQSPNSQNYKLSIKDLGRSLITVDLLDSDSDEFINRENYMKLSKAIVAELDVSFSQFGKLNISHSGNNINFTVPYDQVLSSWREENFLKSLENQFNKVFEIKQEGHVLQINEISKREKKESAEITTYAIRAFKEACKNSNVYEQEPEASYVKHNNEFGVDFTFRSFSLSDDKYKAVMSRFVRYMEQKYPDPAKRWAIRNNILSEDLLKVRQVPKKQ